jgi:hypothetical protein
MHRRFFMDDPAEQSDSPEILPVTQDMFVSEQDLARAAAASPPPPSPAATAPVHAARRVHRPAPGRPHPGQWSQARPAGPAVRSGAWIFWVLGALGLLALAGGAVWWMNSGASRDAAASGSDANGSAAVAAAKTSTDPQAKAAAPGPVAASTAGGGPLAVSAQPTGAGASTAFLAVDEFDYPTGNAAQDPAGGKGWGGAWFGARGKVASGSLIAGSASPGGAGGHVVLSAIEQITLSRPLAEGNVPLTPGASGEFWVSVILAHAGAEGGDGSEVWINFFTSAYINPVIRLTFTEKSGKIFLRGGGSDRQIALDGTSAEARRILAHVTASPAGGKTSDVTMELWINPSAEGFQKATNAFPPPLLKMTVKAVEIPKKPGFCLQKPRHNFATTTRIDSLRMGRTAGDVAP